MPQKIVWAASVSVDSGPAASHITSADVEAYKSIKLELPKEAEDFEVPLRPAGSNKVKFLAISASDYSDITYWMNAAAGGDASKAIALDGPQVFAGGAVALVDDDLQSLFFSNPSTENDTTVEVLVGRDLTPPSP